VLVISTNIGSVSPGCLHQSTKGLGGDHGIPVPC
jgi:hypothetical protein